jgi:hypothetical protein
MGFILNIPTEYKWGIFRLPFHRKHWIGIREISGLYYNLDSKLDAPEIVGKIGELIIYLKEQIEDKDKELLLVVRTAVDEGKTWYRDVKEDTGKLKTGDATNPNGSLSAMGVALEDSGSNNPESRNYPSHLDAEKLVLSFYKYEHLHHESNVMENGSTAESMENGSSYCNNLQVAAHPNGLCTGSETSNVQWFKNSCSAADSQNSDHVS